MTKRVRWIVELDYDADPDTSPDAVRNDVQDQLSASRGSPVIDGERVILDTLDDVFEVRMRYDTHLRRITFDQYA